MNQPVEILPAGAWEREIERPQGVLTPGGGRERAQMFPIKLSSAQYYERKYRSKAWGAQWKAVVESIRTKRAGVSLAGCIDAITKLDAQGAEALRQSGSYGRRNVFTDHARAWVEVHTTMLWLSHGGDIDNGARWPPTAWLKGAKFRRIYHPWASDKVIWIDGFGNHVPSEMGAAIGDDSKILATWDELLATGGYAEGDRLILPTGTRAGAELIRSYNEGAGVGKPIRTPDPAPEQRSQPNPALADLVAECQAHVDAFRRRGHSAALRWDRVIARLRGGAAAQDVTDGALDEWLRLSRQHGWADGQKTLPKVIKELKGLL